MGCLVRVTVVCDFEIAIVMRHNRCSMTFDDAQLSVCVKTRDYTESRALFLLNTYDLLPTSYHISA